MFLSHPNVLTEPALAATSSADNPSVETPSRSRRRRGATAMEYVVMLSFVFLAVILAVQHIGSVTGGSLANSAKKTNITK